MDFFAVENVWLFFLMLFIGALFPDIDHPHSFLNQKLGFTKLIPLLFQHRGFFHSIFLGFILFFFSYLYVTEQLAVAFFIGFASHLAIDCLTKSGICFFYPLQKPKICGPIRTGSFGEFVLLLVIVFVGAVKVVRMI